MSDDKLLLEGQIRETHRDAVANTVEIDLIREGFGNPRDGHYYGRELLESHAGSFTGAKMYINHLDKETERKLAGLPRPVEHVGGRILEAWADTNEAGERVIRGKAKIAQKWLWDLIECDPDLLGVSINARGSSRQGMIEGREAKIVEAISHVGSVDFVTEAGAGGKIRQLVEAQIAEEVAEEEAPEETTPEPEAEASEETQDDGDDEIEYIDVDELDESEFDDIFANDEDYISFLEGEEDFSASDDDPDHYVEEDVEPETPHADSEVDERESIEDLEDAEEEATYTEAEMLEEASAIAAEQLEEAVRAAVEVARAEFNRKLEEATAKFEQQVAQVNQRYVIAGMIESAGFHERTTQALKEQFFDAYFEATVDEDGNVTKSADDVLAEAVSKAIDGKRAEISQYREARVSGAGETSSAGERLGGPAAPKSAPIDDEINKLLGV